MRTFIGRFGALAALLMAASCASTVDYVTGRATLNRYSVEDDVDIGTRHATVLLATTEALGQPTDADDVYTRTVRSVAARILAVPENRARMPPLPWEVHVVGNEQPNAWAFPGGQVVVIAGLMRSGLVRDEDELAAIVGHEMAHAAARHATERRTIEDLRGVISPFGRFFGPRLVALTGASKDLLEALGRSANDYDQAQEIEADVIGLELMARAGYEPSKAPVIWRRLAEGEVQVAGSGAGTTHPKYERRLKELEAHVAVARYVASRRTSAAPDGIARTGWKWTADVPPYGEKQMLDLPPLPEGARVPSQYVRDRRDVLDVSGRVLTGPEGGALPIEVIVTAARDLFEDRLAYTLGVIVEIAGSARAEFATRLAKGSAIERAETVHRGELPRLPPGRYVLRSRVVVGSLWTESVAAFEVRAPVTRR